MALRLAFMGTSAFAVPSLLEIVARGDEIVGVYTRAPKPAGRGMGLKASPVEIEARRHRLRVLHTVTLRTPAAETEFCAHRADAAVVAAYGLILPKPVLDAVRLGCFNVHASLLPRWRGAAPINRAIMAGDAETGVTVIKMDEGLDTGPIAMMERVPIGADATAGEIHDALARLGADLIARVLAALERDRLQLTPQPGTAVEIAPRIENRETHIDWSKHWRAVHNHCRGLSPFPGAWFEAAPGGSEPIRVKVIRTTEGAGAGLPGSVLDDAFNVACGQGAMRILELQRAGRRPMAAGEFLRGLDLRGRVLR
jgi:methionyl-tRNA formyltransferase